MSNNKSENIIIYFDDRISISQINGFKLINDKSVSFRYLNYKKILKGRIDVRGLIKRVWLQVSLYPPIDEIEMVIGLLRDKWPSVTLFFLDWYAPTDLRYTKLFNLCDYYIKKNQHRDLSTYTRGFRDTNLVEYEAKWNIAFLQNRHNGIPIELIKKKLLPGWSFAVDKKLISYLYKEKYLNKVRNIDIHCRMTAPENKDTWYNHMRFRVILAVSAISNQNKVVSNVALKWKDYMNELTNSKICISPFGYGEVCWRDFEAISCGALLVKQDMGHIKVSPEIYLPYETYIPIRWDLSDLEEKCDYYLKHEEERQRIINNAIEIWKGYLKTGISSQWEEYKKLVRL